MADQPQGKTPARPTGGFGLGVVPERVQSSTGKTLYLHAKNGKRLPLTHDRVLLGRQDPGENIVVDIDLEEFEVGAARPSISRRHAEIVRSADGWHIVDLNSANGTQVDGHRLKPGQLQPLRAGCLLMLGRLEFRIEEE